jgi:hypothetical protein
MLSNLSQAVVQQRAHKGPNMNSRQQFSILDRMLVHALDPLAAESESYMSWVAEMLAISVKSRRKNAKEMEYACVRILSGEKQANELLVSAGLDRGHAFDYLKRVIEIHSAISKAEMSVALTGTATRKELEDMQVARDVLGDSPRLSPAVVTAAYWYDSAIKWRDYIVDHYLKLLLKGAIGMNRASGGRIETDPTFHEAWISAALSADRFRSDSGAFASFLQRSLKGTFRVAASNSLGLAAPGARVHSDEALQTSPLEVAIDMKDNSVGHEEEDAMILRAVMALSRVPDVRISLIVSELSPISAMKSVGIGPGTNRVK